MEQTLSTATCCFLPTHYTIPELLQLKFSATHTFFSVAARAHRLRASELRAIMHREGGKALAPSSLRDFPTFSIL